MSQQRQREHCPVCGDPGHHHPIKWVIPFAPLEKAVTIQGATVKTMPLLEQERGDSLQTETVWIECEACETIYLQTPPVANTSGDHYIKKMETPREWEGYRRRWEWMKEEIPLLSAQGVLVDAAGGIGQYAWLARSDFDDTYLMEINHEYILHAEQCGAVNYGIHVDFDDHTAPPRETETTLYGTADCVVFSEAFEHMFDARIVLERLLKLLAPGGVLFFSAQSRYGGLPVRMEETIYTAPAPLGRMVSSLGCSWVNPTSYLDLELRSGRYWCLISKDPVDENTPAPERPGA